MTRQEYLDSKDTRDVAYRTYYSQFVNNSIKKRVLWVIALDALLKSTDRHFNDISLERWDNVFCLIAPSDVAAKMHELGDYPTPAGLVCVAKEAARQIIEDEAKKSEGGTPA